MEPTSSQEELARLWTLAQPSLAAFIASMLPRYHDAQDVLQEVAVVLLRKFGEYDRKRTFFAWAAGIARNEVLAWRRRNAATPASIMLDESALEHVSQAFDRWGDGLGEFGDAMERCLGQLRGKSLSLIELRYREGLTSTEIGARTHATPGSVDVALHRIRESIRNCIERRLTGQGKVEA